MTLETQSREEQALMSLKAANEKLETAILENTSGQDSDPWLECLEVLKGVEAQLESIILKQQASQKPKKLKQLQLLNEA